LYSSDNAQPIFNKWIEDTVGNVVTVGVSIGNHACYFVQIMKVDVQFNNKLSTPVSIDDPTLGRLLRLLPGETKSIVGDVRTTYTSTQYSGPETWTSSKGGFAAGNDVKLGEAGNRMPIANAKQLCEKDSTCRGFTFDAGKLRNGSPKLTKGSFTIFFKNLVQHAITPDMENGGWSESWVKYVKQQGLRGKTTRHHPTYSQTFEIDDSDTADGSLIYKTNACPTHNDLAHYDDDVEEENFPGTQSEFLEHRDRQLRNMVQPHVVPAFTAVGFEKRKLPEHIFSRLRQFYDQNIDAFTGVLKSTPEGEVKKTYNIHLPEAEKNCVHGHLQDIVEEVSSFCRVLALSNYSVACSGLKSG
jgi:hypothetical protein